MPDLLDRDSLTALRVEVDERLARAELRRQIGRLERELAGLFAEAFAALEIDAPGRRRSPPSRGSLDLGELERVRDDLAERIAEARAGPARARRRRDRATASCCERMLAAPAEHKWVRICRADVGEPGCGHWHSRPRLGPLGMLMGWWRVKVSSGCPLAGRLAAVERSAGKQRDSQADERPPAPWGTFPLAELTDPRRHRRAGRSASSAAPDRDRRRRRPRRPRRHGGRDPRALRRLPLPHDPARRGRLRPRRRRPLLPRRPDPGGLPWRSAPSPSRSPSCLARRAFQRASGGLSFRVGGMRG